MKRIDSDLMAELTQAAAAGARLRQHRNFHASLDDPCQRLVVAMMPGSYIPPHRHLSTPKDELFVMLQGEAAVVIFSETGDVETVTKIGSGSRTVGAEIPAGAWHTVIALKESVFLEVKAGPYAPLPNEDRAAWAPLEGDAEAAGYLEGLRFKVAEFGS